MNNRNSSIKKTLKKCNPFWQLITGMIRFPESGYFLPISCYFPPRHCLAPEVTPGDHLVQRKGAKSHDFGFRTGLGTLKSLNVTRFIAILMYGIMLNGQTLAATQCNIAGTAIPDNGNVDVSVNYQVGDVSSNIFDVNLSLDISHTWVGDLESTVSSPAATGPVTVQVFDRPGSPPGFGCRRNDLNVTFDDEAASGTNIENVCNPGPSPTISGAYQPQNIGTNPLSDYDGIQPNGAWTFNVSDNAGGDTGTVNSACVTIQHAAVTFDKWVSTDATCSDTLESLTVAQGANVYYCYTVSNPGTEQLVLNAGNATDNQGLDISGLEGTYAPGATNTIVLGPYTAGGAELPLGTTTNIAQVTMTGDSANFPATQTLVTGETATVLVSNVPPASGNKPLYLATGNTLSRAIPGAPVNVTINEGTSDSWILSPALATALTIDGASSQIPVTLSLGEAGPGQFRSFTLTLTSSDGTLVATGGPYTRDLNPSYTETYNLGIATSGALSINSTITLTISNTSTGNGNRRIVVAPAGSSASGSFVNLPSSTVVNVDSVYFYDATLGKVVPGAAPGQPNIYVRAVISDPFGWTDVTSATVAMTGGPCTISAATMTAISNTASTRTFQSDATVTTVGNPATCTTSVTGYEGNEPVATQVTHTNSADLLIGNPSLTIVKSVVGVSKPGQILTYSIVVANAGNGYTNSVSLADILSPYTAFNLSALPPSSAPFALSDGIPCGTASGLTLGSPEYANDRPPTYAYVPGATGFDSAITAWRMSSLTGSMNPNSCFTLQYQAQVK